MIYWASSEEYSKFCISTWDGSNGLKSEINILSKDAPSLWRCRLAFTGHALCIWLGSPVQGASPTRCTSFDCRREHFGIFPQKSSSGTSLSSIRRYVQLVSIMAVSYSSSSFGSPAALGHEKSERIMLDAEMGLVLEERTRGEERIFESCHSLKYIELLHW